MTIVISASEWEVWTVFTWDLDLHFPLGGEKGLCEQPIREAAHTQDMAPDWRNTELRDTQTEWPFTTK